MHLLQSLVQKFRREILPVDPRDGCQPVVEIELREAVPIAQRFHVFSVQLVGQIDDPFASIVEFQPNLVVSEIARLNDMTGCVLITGQRLPPFAMSSTVNKTARTGAEKSARDGEVPALRPRAPAQQLHLPGLPSILCRSAKRIGPFRHCGSLSRPSP